MNEPKDWSQYQELVLAELHRHGENIDATRKDIAEMKTGIALLKFKASLWGGVGGIGGAGLIAAILKTFIG